MLEPTTSHPRPNPAPLQAAKWPPDDDDLPDAPPPGGGGSPAGGDEGNFKKGRFNPVVVVVGLLAVALGVAFLVFGITKDQERLTIEQAEQRKKAIFVLPKAEQAPKWREWATTTQSDELRAEALKQLAWLRDEAGIDACIASLKFPSEPVQAMAAVALAEYGSPMADRAKPALLEALKVAGPGAKPQIGWALVALGEASAFQDVMKLYRAGHLATVQRLGGGNAFDPEKLVKMVSTDELVKLADDETAGVRQLVATVLSRLADPKYTDVLVKLVKDPDPEVARMAAPGLGKIGDDKARGPLLLALKGADKEGREKILLALRDGQGTDGLVLALEGIDAPDEKTAWYQRKVIFSMIRDEQLTDATATTGSSGNSDPAGGDALNRYLAGKPPHMHWEWQAAMALAEIGDVRAVPTLAKRLRMDPTKLYSDANDWEMALKRDDKERVESARMLADLAVLHPDKAEQLRVQAEDAVFFWISEMPSPHANGLRALAAMGSTKYVDRLRKWANPDKPLPKEGQQPPMPEEWVIAQSAMRYVGWMRDQQSWDWLEKALKKRSPELDVTMDGLMQGGKAILGMTLRALGVGAADGFAQWGDPKAFKPLLEYVESTKDNEQSRKAACAALAWVATKENMVEIAKKILQYDKADKADAFRRECLLETMITRPVPGTATALLQLLVPEAPIETKLQVARAIGKAGFDQEVEKKLFEMQAQDALVEPATLALILGGGPDVAARAVAQLADKPKEVLEQLATHWYKTFGYWSDEDLESGRIFRWVDTAVAISRVEIRQTPQEWAPAMLTRQMQNLLFDNGPRSFTRVVLRYRLWKMAQGDDAEKRSGAIRTLKFMAERGVLRALRDLKGPGQEEAKQAYFELMNPKLGLNVKMPDQEK